MPSKVRVSHKNRDAPQGRPQVTAQLEPTGQGLRGRPQAIDLNYISAPSDSPEQPPHQPEQRDEIAPGVRWIQSLSIE